ncbi:uncharacterized protein [Drosophila pseudoobscura]|uniref:Uncharacterized protein isoform X1 n=1 Tax=Drosophila pseudoobscura pseudoobscura TaxID=46245 RepID=A0A6I8UYE5_DROPS|nr:uncharacterized protein LOC6901842 isoform X1 [Drosophila pseudoobscura]
MGRPRTIDVTNLVVIFPDKNFCRCVLCDRTLAGCLRSNIKRHYQRLHPEVVLPRPQDTGPPGQTKKSVTEVSKMGRTPIMDTRTLVNLQPDGRRCRCRICDKTLIFLSGNVRRHYKNYHPQHIPDRPSYNPPAENRKHLNRSRNKADLTIDPATIMTTTMETGDEDDKASSSRLSNDQFESIFIGKSEVPDVVEVDFSGDQLIDHDKMRYSQSLNQSEPPITAAMTMTSTPSASASAPRTSSVALLPSPTLSADDAFFLQYLGNKFGNYSTRTKHTVQFQINRILYRADMGCFEDADASQLNESEIV